MLDRAGLVDLVDLEYALETGNEGNARFGILGFGDYARFSVVCSL